MTFTRGIMGLAGWRAAGIVCLAACAGAPPTVARLIQDVRRPSVPVKVRALNELAGFGPQARDALPALLESFRDRDMAVHAAAGRALVAVGTPGLQGLGSLLSDTDSWVRCRAATALADVGPPAEAALMALVGAVDDNDVCTADQAAGALARIGEPAVPPLLTLLKSDNSAQRQGAAAALGGMSHALQSRAVEVLVPALKSRDEFVRGEAAMRITSMGRVGVPAFLAVIHDRDKDLRHRALLGLQEIGDSRPEVVDALIVLFNDDERTLRIKSAFTLGDMGRRNSDVYGPVAARIGSTNPRTLTGVVRALGQMGGVAESSLPDLVKIMHEHPSADLREEAMEALIRMGTLQSLRAAEFRRGSNTQSE